MGSTQSLPTPNEEDKNEGRVPMDQIIKVGNGDKDWNGGGWGIVDQDGIRGLDLRDPEDSCDEAGGRSFSGEAFQADSR